MTSVFLELSVILWIDRSALKCNVHNLYQSELFPILSQISGFNDVTFSLSVFVIMHLCHEGE